jgi:hypothetical protein
MKLQQYDFQIQHHAGKGNSNADALSRMYKEEENQTFSCFMISIKAEGYETDIEDAQPNTTTTTAVPQISSEILECNTNIPEMCEKCGNLAPCETE